MSKTKKAASTTAAKTVAKSSVKSNASQRIQALEDLVLNQDRKFNILADEIDGLRSLINALNKRLNAAIKAAEQGGLSGEAVTRLIVEDNVKELEEKVTMLVEQGLIAKSESGKIGEKSFIVGREISEEGNVVNLRIQFALPVIQDKTLKDKLLSSKLGDIMKPEKEGELSLEIMEVYEIVEQKVEQEFKEEEVTE